MTSKQLERMLRKEFTHTLAKPIVVLHVRHEWPTFLNTSVDLFVVKIAPRPSSVIEPFYTVYRAHNDSTQADYMANFPDYVSAVDFINNPFKNPYKPNK